MLEYSVTEQIKYEPPAHDLHWAVPQALGRRIALLGHASSANVFGLVMESAEKKAEAGKKTSLGDLERLVKVRKYDHCRAEYTKLAMEPNTMQVVRDRYFRIAQYYQELADTEPAGTTAAKRENGDSPL